MWVYVQRTGIMYSDAAGPAQPLARGYSGWGSSENNPDAQCDEKHGPLPRGVYTLTAPVEFNHMPDCLRLVPDAGNDMCHRSGFLIHDGVWNGPHGQTSLGCICVPHAARLTMWGSGDHTLKVVADSATENLLTPPRLDLLAAAEVAVAGPVQFGSLIAGGFFSSDPDDMSVPRSIRTNNPGALNVTGWQRTWPGYAGSTDSDGSPNQNHTTIYRTPEHGVAAWYHLVADLYGFAPGVGFSLRDLAARYAGRDADTATVDGYVSGWTAKSGGTLPSQLDLSVSGVPLQLARAMFAFEAGRPSPLLDVQITAAISWEFNNLLPP